MDILVLYSFNPKLLCFCGKKFWTNLFLNLRKMSLQYRYDFAILSLAYLSL